MDHLFQVFHFRVDRENRAQHMFSQDVVTTIFSNIKSIYLFHAEHVLPQVSLFTLLHLTPLSLPLSMRKSDQLV